MIASLLLFVISVFGLALALIVPGLTDLVMLAGPMALASLWLLLPHVVGRHPGATRAVRDTHTLPLKPKGGLFGRAKASPKWVVVDGSNVMHWKDGEPQIETVQAVVAKLAAAGFSPGVVFDANAGYKLLGKYKHDHAFGRLLGLPEDRVMVVNKGNPADPTILEAARDLGARVVSNDRFRDWAESYPEVAKPGHVIAGGYRDGQLWLELN